MQEDTGPNVTVAEPLRSFAQRFTFILLLGASIGLLMVGRTDPKIFEQARMVLIDSTAPVLDGLSRPVAIVSAAVENIRELAHLRQENMAL
ncbi:MAG: rod shape-determining protein MreC, partial [Pseudomonadota bacterium]|nr:rod shape-determining protein MreC [Pseudomonadota bacterium]